MKGRFNKRSARRLAETARRVEQTPRFPVASRQGSTPTGPCVYLLVTQQVGVKSGATLGKGKGKLQVVTFNESSEDMTIGDHPDTTEYRIYSLAVPSSATIAVGRYVICAPMGGRFHVLTDFCIA